MSDAGRFLIYCIEMYRRAKQISGRAAYELFRSVGADEYVQYYADYYEALNN